MLFQEWTRLSCKPNANPNSYDNKHQKKSQSFKWLSEYIRFSPSTHFQLSQNMSISLINFKK